MTEDKWIPIPAPPIIPPLVLPKIPEDKIPEDGWRLPDKKFTEGFIEIEPILINKLENGVINIKGIIRVEEIPSKIVLFSDKSLKEKNCFIEQPVGGFNMETFRTNATLYAFSDGLCELSIYNKSPNEIIINTSLL